MPEIIELRARFIKMRSSLNTIKWMAGIALGGITALVLKAFFPG